MNEEADPPKDPPTPPQMPPTRVNRVAETNEQTPPRITPSTPPPAAESGDAVGPGDRARRRDKMSDEPREFFGINAPEGSTLQPIVKTPKTLEGAKADISEWREDFRKTRIGTKLNGTQWAILDLLLLAVEKPLDAKRQLRCDLHLTDMVEYFKTDKPLTHWSIRRALNRLIDLKLIRPAIAGSLEGGFFILDCDPQRLPFYAPQAPQTPNNEGLFQSVDLRAAPTEATPLARRANEHAESEGTLNTEHARENDLDLTRGLAEDDLKTYSRARLRKEKFR
jgi:hypothetical protein